MVKVRLPDGKLLDFPDGTTAAEVVASIGPGLARKTIAARLDGAVSDLSTRLRSDGEPVALQGAGVALEQREIRIIETAAELDRDGMLTWIEAQEPRPVAPQHRAGGEHFGVKQRAARQLAMEEATMPVRPVNHRRDRQFEVAVAAHFSIPVDAHASEAAPIP